jgi:hypothetical protein
MKTLNVITPYRGHEYEVEVDRHQVQFAGYGHKRVTLTVKLEARSQYDDRTKLDIKKNFDITTNDVGFFDQLEIPQFRSEAEAQDNTIIDRFFSDIEDEVGEWIEDQEESISEAYDAELAADAAESEE